MSEDESMAPQEETLPEKRSRSKAVAKKGVSEFAIFRVPQSQITELIELNLGGQKLNEFDLERIRVPSGETKHWTIPTPEGEDVVKTLDGVVVFFKDVRAWWPDPEPTGKPPQCRSDDGARGLGIRWEEDDPGVYHDCTTCKYASFGSDPGGAGQWCKQMKAIFLLRKETFLPTAVFLPPTSLKATRQFFMRLLNHGIPYYGVEVSYTLEGDKNATGQAYNRAVPKQKRRLSEEEQQLLKSYIVDIKPALTRVSIENDNDYYGKDQTTAEPDGSS